MRIINICSPADSIPSNVLMTTNFPPILISLLISTSVAVLEECSVSGTVLVETLYFGNAVYCYRDQRERERDTALTGLYIILQMALGTQ